MKKEVNGFMVLTKTNVKTLVTNVCNMHALAYGVNPFYKNKNIKIMEYDTKNNGTSLEYVIFKHSSDTYKLTHTYNGFELTSIK